MVKLTQIEPSLRRLYQIFALVLGFGLIVFGFNAISVGIHGAGAFTSEFLAANVLLGGSVLIFVSIYYLLKPVNPSPPGELPSTPVGPRPDVGVELIVEEQTPPKPGFYKNIMYIGYFFTLLGLVSAADLVLQVFIRSTYNEALWWVEILLVVFGVLSYTIFGSVGRIGAQEEAQLAGLPSPAVQPKTEPQPTFKPAVAPILGPVPTEIASQGTEAAGALVLRPAEFTRNSEGEFERHLSGESYDMFRVGSDLVTVWREDRRGMRSVYLAGPYELTRKMLAEHLKNREELRVGELILSPDAIGELLKLSEPAGDSKATVSEPHGG